MGLSKRNDMVKCMYVELQLFDITAVLLYISQFMYLFIHSNSKHVFCVLDQAIVTKDSSQSNC